MKIALIERLCTETQDAHPTKVTTEWQPGPTDTDGGCGGRGGRGVVTPEKSVKNLPRQGVRSVPVQ